MESQEQKERLKDFHLKDKQRQLQQLRATISSFKCIVNDLEKQIAIEERKSGIYDKDHFTYPIFAKSARQRVDNLLISIRDLLSKQESLEDDLQNIKSNSEPHIASV
ncbi:hypothetical protein [Candidatus Liberibacter americanus]|uniref:Uncharacterized protein n=1 Tax=Candidatus Liberibacter americanus str. Sao Paulo TaxID=1261131 RepID=U6B4R3_9HYPH|nr:hypothetical protein [Candidatus Liberibacter americanus]AHA27885.1 hypothetical protein lam_532 [Candidatus Liberibacter americanus str. Sao Paulo]EMS36118.1 hypothetical protein G653_03361 [Candidatus Liberibacter americanus PW_SP]